MDIWTIVGVVLGAISVALGFWALKQRKPHTVNTVTNSRDVKQRGAKDRTVENRAEDSTNVDQSG